MRRFLQARGPLAVAESVNRLPVPEGIGAVRIGPDTLRARRWDRVVALWLWKLGWRESAETRAVRRFVSRGMHVVDVGANIGLFTLLMSRLVGSRGRVWAFEPDPSNYRALAENIHSNRVSNVQARAQAVGASGGIARLHLSMANAGDHRIYSPPNESRPTVSVECVTLDSVLSSESPIDFIKIDIQGGEHQAILGMRKVWEASPSLMVLLEFWPGGLRQSGTNPEEFLESLRLIGGRVRRVRPDGKAGAAVEATDRLVQEVGTIADVPLLVGPRMRTQSPRPRKESKPI